LTPIGLESPNGTNACGLLALSILRAMLFIYNKMFEIPEEKHRDIIPSPENENHPERVPHIREGDFSVLLEIGGYYKGVVESPEGKRFEDIWRDVNAIYEFADHTFVRTSVETRAYGKDLSIQNATEIEGYRISIEFQSLKDRTITRQYHLEISAADAHLDYERMRAVADKMHQFVVHDLDTLPRSPKRVSKEIHSFIRDWKLDHVDLRDIQRSADDWGDDGNDDAEASSS
jgi:hypothetical protein